MSAASEFTKIRQELIRRNALLEDAPPVLPPGTQPRLDAFQLQNPLTPDQAAQLAGYVKGQVGFEAPVLEDVNPNTLSGVAPNGSKIGQVGTSLQLEDFNESIMLAASPHTTAPVQAFLRPVFVEGALLRKVAPQLAFLELANEMRSDAHNITYFQEPNSAFTDPLLRLPQPLEEGSTDFVIVGGTNPTKKHISIGTYKLGIIFTKMAMMNDTNAFNEVSRKLDRMAYAMAFQWNKLYSDVIANEFDTTVNSAKPTDEQVQTFTATNAWSTGAGDPLQDILDGQQQMKVNTENYRNPTDLWLNPPEFLDLYKFMISQDHDWAFTPSGERGSQFGDGPTGRQTTMNIRGILVREIPPDSGMPVDRGLLMARDARFGGTILDTWDLVEPNLSRSGLVHVQRVDDEPATSGNTLITMHRNWCGVNRDPNSVLFFVGI